MIFTTNTSTPTPTPTLNPFPSTGVLDNFNRSNGTIGSNWAGSMTAFSIVNNKMRVNGSDYILWNNPLIFGVNQEDYVTLSSINGSADEIDLLLKGHDEAEDNGVIEILYHPSDGTVKVRTHTNTQGWVQRGANINVTFAVGDRFGARAKVDGTVEVYKNNTLLGVCRQKVSDRKGVGGRET